MMNSNAWYRHSFRRLLVDMHIPDWDSRMLKDFSPENYAEMMRLANVDCAEIYAGSCLGLSFWPTKVGFPHKQLNGRDLLGETVDACRRRGIKVVIYLNVWSRAAHDAHPEWRMIMEDGKGTVDHFQFRFGLCCPNTPFGSYFLDLLDELNSGYDCLGFWIDMIGWFCYTCYCPACRERFRKETGFAELPRKMDWNDPAWIAFQKCRMNWLDEFAGNIYETVRKRHPERSVALQTTSIVRGWESAVGNTFLESSDYLAGDFVGDRIEQSAICKYFSAIAKDRPMEFMTPRCENLLHHTTERSFENLRMRSFAAIANQASFTLIDAIDPAGTLDRRFYEHAKLINDSYARYEKYLDGDSIPLSDVAIYNSVGAMVPFGEDRCFSPDERTVHRNLTHAFMQSHLLFTFARGENAEEFRRKYPVMIVSDCARLSNAECDALQQYVREGGRLYASCHTSLYDPETGRRSDFRLAEVFGVHATEDATEKITYIAPASGFFPDCVTKEYPVMLDGAQLYVKAAPDAEVVGTLTLPCSTEKELFRFGSAISNPPMIATAHPAMIRHRYGKGEVLYCAGSLESVPYDFQRNLFAEFIRKLRGTPLVTTNAPATVELTLFDQPAKRRLILNVLNLPDNLPPPKLTDLEIQLNLAGRNPVQRVLRAPEDVEYPFSAGKETVTIRLDSMKEFELFVLEY